MQYFQPHRLTSFLPTVRVYDRYLKSHICGSNIMRDESQVHGQSMRYRLRTLTCFRYTLAMATNAVTEVSLYMVRDIRPHLTTITAWEGDIYVHTRQEDPRTWARKETITLYSSADEIKELVVVKDEQMMVHVESQYGFLYILVRVNTKRDHIIVNVVKDMSVKLNMSISQMVPRRDKVTLAIGRNFFYHYDGAKCKIGAYTIQGHLRHACRVPEVVCRKGLIDLHSTTKDDLVIAENELDRTFYGLRFPGCDILWKFEESNIVIHSFADRILYLRKETGEMVQVNPFTGEWGYSGRNVLLVTSCRLYIVVHPACIKYCSEVCSFCEEIWSSDCLDLYRKK